MELATKDFLEMVNALALLVGQEPFVIGALLDTLEPTVILAPTVCMALATKDFQEMANALA
jgi:hypothetical protein